MPIALASSDSTNSLAQLEFLPFPDYSFVMQVVMKVELDRPCGLSKLSV